MPLSVILEDIQAQIATAHAAEAANPSVAPIGVMVSEVDVSFQISKSSTYVADVTGTATLPVIKADLSATKATSTQNIVTVKLLSPWPLSKDTLIGDKNVKYIDRDWEAIKAGKPAPGGGLPNPPVLNSLRECGKVGQPACLLK